MADVISPNEMTYSGNHLYHYTNLDSAIKIILSNSLRFGNFSNMNDIAEVRRELYDNIDSETLDSIVAKYQAISLTIDSEDIRGFAIDALWGYYADKGNGVCLVFDRDKLLEEYKKSCRSDDDGIPDDLSIKYEVNFSNLNFGEGDSPEDLETYVRGNIDELFYKKDICWQHEKELRLLVKSEGETYLNYADALIGAIICVPKEDNYKNSNQYKLLSNLQEIRSFSIYRYTRSLGTRELLKDNERVWPLLELDDKLDI